MQSVISHLPCVASAGAQPYDVYRTIASHEFLRVTLALAFHNKVYMCRYKNKTKFLNDTDFIIRMLYKYSY